MVNIIKTDDALFCNTAEPHTETIPFENRDLFQRAESIEELIKNQSIWYVLKHSQICPISHTAYERVVLAIQSKVIQEPLYLIVVQEQRELSNQVAEYFSIQHESPQLIKIQDDTVVEVRNHLDILK